MARSSATSAATLDSDTDAPEDLAPLGDSSASDPALALALTTAAPIAPPMPRAGQSGHSALGGLGTLVDELDHVIAEMTYHGLARATGLSRSHITGVLKGRRLCTVGFAVRVARALGVSVTELYEYVARKRHAKIGDISKVGIAKARRPAKPARSTPKVAGARRSSKTRA
jgi:hypothetical protein